VPKRLTKGNLWGFIQSRPYVSVADIRRLFYMEVEDASPVHTDEGTCYIGLPQSAADLVRQLWQEGRIVLDLNPDLKARVVQGIYPARISLTRSRTTVVEGTESSMPSVEPSTTAKRKRKRRRRHKAETGDDSSPS
jgi:hypothetical protein